MNTRKLFGFCLLLLLAVMPLSLAAPGMTFQEKLDLAVQRGNTVRAFQVDIADDFPAAPGGQINQAKLNNYLAALQIYNDAILSLPEFILNQNGAIVENLVVLHAQVDVISADNQMIINKLSLAQRKPLVLEQSRSNQAVTYVDDFMSLALAGYQLQKINVGTTYTRDVAAYQELVARSQVQVIQSEYAAASAQFASDKAALATKFNNDQTNFFDLGRQARALGRMADSAALTVLQAQAKANLALTNGLEMLPPIANPNPAVDPDSDNDGIVDSKDNCKNVANANQADTDSDGIGDVCDNQVLPIVDSDSDGIADAQDNCPAVANADQANLDGDAMGDACDTDKDGDGILNDVDNCPVNANADQANSDGDSLGNVCDADSVLTAHEQRLVDLTTRFNNYEDDYNEYERKYERAKREDDTSDENKYHKKLDDLLDNVEDLQNDLDDLLNDVEDDDNDPQLENDIEDAIDDVNKLHEDITDTLGINTSSNTNIDSSRTVSPPSSRTAIPPTEAVQPVELQTFTGTTVDTPVSTSSGWEGMRMYAWIGVGAILIVAVLMLLIAAIMRK